MIGIVKNTLPGGREMNAFQALDAAARLGMKGLLFNTLHDISARLDPAEMKTVQVEASSLGLRISANLGFVNPGLPFRSQAIVDAGDGDLRAGLRRLVGLAADIGIHDLFFVVGMIEERFRTDVSWQAQCDAVAAMVLDCAPVLRERGSRLLVKTHEEITTTEILDILRKVGPDLFGIAYDPVNVLCRMEDPVEAARRIAPYTAQLHVDDAVVRFQDGGMRRFLAPLGEGAIEWDAIFALMPKAFRWVETHTGQFAMPVFDREWLRAQPGIALSEFASVLQMATAFGSRDIPWDQTKPADRLPHAFGKLQND
mgnify:CR=1 FL=1